MSFDKLITSLGTRKASAVTYWRIAPANTLGVREVNRLRCALCGFQILGEPNWQDAIHGNAAAAIGIAIRVAMRQSCIEAISDLVMSPVLIAAISGNGAARMSLMHMLHRREAFDPVAKKLAASWLEVSCDVEQTRRSIKAMSLAPPPCSRRATSCVRVC